MSSWMLSGDCVQRKTRQVSQPEWDYKRSLVSLVAQVGIQRQRRGVSLLRWRDIKLPTRLQKKIYIYQMAPLKYAHPPRSECGGAGAAGSAHVGLQERLGGQRRGR